MPTKSVKRKIEWIIENVTREKLENPEFKIKSERFFILFGCIGEW